MQYEITYPYLLYAMNQSKDIAIGTRGSALALAQTNIVADALKAVDPSLIVRVSVIQTYGDVNQSAIPLDTIGKGWFTKEIEDALINGEIDLAVHSLKDMSEDMPQELEIGAYLPRGDARDVLVTKHGEPLEKLKSGAIVGTDSSRRQVQIKALRQDLEVRSLRGNVPTRLQKLQSEDYDAIVIAAAGLQRLGLQEKIISYFEPEEMTPAPGQGILAVQIKKDNIELKTLLEKISDPEAARAAHIERSFSAMLEGGCKTPIGAYAFSKDKDFYLIGMMLGQDGNIIRKEISAAKEASENLGQSLAGQFLEHEKRRE